MPLWKLRRHAKEDHARVERTLEARREELVDMAMRIVRLEAEVDIYRPLYVDKTRISAG